jgi:regulator of extracellular matrix RemA (YlzA/DUF370 family)
MRAQLLHVGLGSVIAASRVIAILPGTSGARGAFSTSTGRLIAGAREQGRVIDVTSGRRTKAVLVLDTGHVVLAAVTPRTIVARLEGEAGPTLARWQETGAPEE